MDLICFLVHCFPYTWGNFLIYQISKLAALLHTRRKSHVQSNALPLQQAGAVVMDCSPVATKKHKEKIKERIETKRECYQLKSRKL